MKETYTQFEQFARFWMARFRNALIAFFLVLVLGTAAIFVLVPRVQAFGSDLNAARTRYPFIDNTRLEDCTLCHVQGSNNLNPYGQDYLDSGRDFLLIEPMDSDGDSFSNLIEISALSFPGDAGDLPVQPTPTFTPFPAFTNTPVMTPTDIPPTATEPPPPTATPGATQPPATGTPPATEPPPSGTPPATEPPTGTPGGPTPTPTEMGTATPDATPAEPTPTPLPDTLDLDIKHVKIDKHIKLDKVKPIGIRLDIKNNSTAGGQGTVTVIGVQNGVEVYNQNLAVSDPPGGGHSRYYLPSYVPAASGTIQWTISLSDENPDLDEAMATTEVSGEPPGGDGTGSLDLDIQSFKTTSHLKFDKVKPVEIRLDIRNNGMVAGQAMLTVTGMQGGVQVYSQSMAVSDPVGGGHSRYFFPSYVPTASGEIVWTAILSDEDPDNDLATASTWVDP